MISERRAGEKYTFAQAAPFLPGYVRSGISSQNGAGDERHILAVALTTTLTRYSHVLWLADSRGASRLRLACRAHAPSRTNPGPPPHRAPRRGRRLFSSAATGLCDGRAQFSLPSLTRRNRPDWLGERCLVLYRGKNTYDPRRKTRRSCRGPRQTAGADSRRPRLPPASGTSVPVAF